MKTVLRNTIVVLVVFILFMTDSSQAFTGSNRQSIAFRRATSSSANTPWTTSSFRVEQQTNSGTKVGTSSSSALWDDKMSNYDGSIDGTNVGPYILAATCAVAVWLFTIPTEFRRARFCSEADTLKYPTICTTPGRWSSGIKEYYANGGGVKFDFSVEKEGNPWAGGTFREEE